MITATATHLEQLRLRAVNDVTREIAAQGVRLTHEQADDLGEVVIDWMRGELDLAIYTDDVGVTLAPRDRLADDSADETSTDEAEPPAIDDRQIRILRKEAAQAGDADQIAICDLALEGEIDVDDYTGLSRELSSKLRSMTSAEARIECARVIAAARAQRDVRS